MRNDEECEPQDFTDFADFQRQLHPQQSPSVRLSALSAMESLEGHPMADILPTRPARSGRTGQRPFGSLGEPIEVPAVRNVKHAASE